MLVLYYVVCDGNIVLVLQKSVQRPRETLFQFHPEDSGTQELCVVLTLDPGKSSHTLPTTGASVPMSPNPGSPVPLAGIWADRSHVIRPHPPSSDSLRRPLIPPSSPSDMSRTRPLFSPSISSSESSRSSRDSSLSSNVGAGQVGAWGKPGSGAAVVKRMGEPHPHAPHLHVTPKQLKHSTSGPVRGHGQGPCNEGSRRFSDDQGSQGQWKGQQRGSWCRVSNDRKGERSKVGPIVEQERYQRSHSTTQAHKQNQSNRKLHPHRKPHTEPNHHDKS